MRGAEAAAGASAHGSAHTSAGPPAGASADASDGSSTKAPVEHRLELVLDSALGPALWVREQIAPGRARAAQDLASLLAACPPALGAALEQPGRPTRLRHRARLSGADGSADRRVPALALAPARLLALVGAVRARLRERFGAEAIETVGSLIGEGRAVLLAEGVSAAPSLLGAALLDARAEELVGARRLRVEVVEEPDGPHLRWRPLEDEGRPLLDALVDARARAAFAAHLAAPSTPSSSEPGAPGPSAPDAPGPAAPCSSAPGAPSPSAPDAPGPAAPCSSAPGAPGPSAPDAPSPSAPPASATPPDGVLEALASEEPLAMELPAQRALVRAIDAMLATGRTGVKLAEADAELVVRLHEPPLGTAWPLQTCLRESDGTVHPVADLRAVGDVSAAGAAEASAAVLRLAPTVRAAAVDDTGVDWLLTTAEASAFLTHDTPALEAAGVTVLLPRDWTKQRTTLRPEADEPEDAEAQRKRGGGVGLAAMASFRWKVAVGDVELTDEEIEEIREAQAEIVQLRGKWVRLDPTTLRAAERFLDAFTQRTRAHRTASAEPDGTGAHAPATRPGPESRTRKRPVVPGRSAISSAGTGVSGQDASDPHLHPAPALVSGDLTWADLFAMLLDESADGLALDALRVAPGAAAPLLRLLPGGPGPAPLPQPATLRATLRPYQLAGVDWMWALHELDLGGILADDMGLGKTMQVLALLLRERELASGPTDPTAAATDPTAAATDPTTAASDPTGPTAASTAPGAGTGAAGAHAAAPGVGPTLLVCPMSVVGAWQREAAKWAPDLSVTVHHGGDRIRDESFAPGAADTDLVLTTYSLLARDLRILSAVDWHRVVFDEAQHLKNPGTQVTRAARALPAAHRLALTGTPVENRLGDLHALMEAVNPGLLGPLAQFRERIAGPVEEEGDPGALARLKLVASPFVLRRVKTDRAIIQDLPEKTELRRIVNLTPEQAGLYEAIVEELMGQIDGADEKQRRTLVVSALTRLKQVCNHPAHYLGDGSPLLRGGEHRSGKLELVDDLLAEAFDTGRKVLAFTQFTTFGQLLAPHWAERFGIDVPFLHGGVAKRDRDAMVEAFQARPDEPGVMLLSLRAGGTGLTLTAASEVVHLDRWWNPAVENQATDRAFRIGQRRDVTVHKLVSAGTVEEKIDDVLARKQELADLTIAPGKDWLADLDDAGLRALLTLSEPAP